MRAARLDRRIRKEASQLVREARTALAVKKGLRGKAGDLETSVAEVERGLADRDLARVRRGLPALDALVDELIKRPPKSTTRDYVESIGAAILIALALRAFVIEAFKIPSSSMYPTLEIGDHIFVNKFIYGVRIPWTNTKLFELRKPRRGEVIVFMQPCTPDRDYIKRVVALENDTVEVRCNVLYVNGTAVPNAYIDGDCQYQDYDEYTHTWSTRYCSRYRETVDGLAYDVFHDAERPARDEELGRRGTLRGSDHTTPRRSTISCAAARTCRRRRAARRGISSRASSSRRGRARTRASRSCITWSRPGTCSRWATTARTRMTRATGARCRWRTSRARRCSSGCRIATGR